MGLWERINRTHKYEIEAGFWTYLLQECSILTPGTKVQDLEGCLSSEARDQIWKAHPSIPRSLVRPVFESSFLTKREELQIERESFEVFLSKTPKRLYNPHPLTTKIIVAMSFKEQYGVSLGSAFDDLPYREFQGMKIVLDAFNGSQEVRKNENRLREEAIRKSGRR